MSTVSTRYHGDLPRKSAAEAVSTIGSDDTVLVSGFGKVGYPKAIPAAVLDLDRDFSLTIVSGGNVGEEIDTDLVEAGVLARRFPVQSSPVIRTAVNDGAVAYHDRHLSQIGMEARMGYYGHPAVAVIEAVAVGPDWLIPSASIGQTPAFVQCAEQLIVEVNEAQPLGLQHFHDIHLQDLPPHRDPIPLSDPGDRIGTSRVEFDPEKLSAVVSTNQPDSPYEFRDATDTDAHIARHLLGFLQTESTRNPVLSDRLVLQYGVGGLGNVLMEHLGPSVFDDRDLVYYGEVMQDGLLDPIESGVIQSASATSFALSTAGLDRLFRDIDRYTDRVILRNSDLSNHPGLIEQFGVIGINAALEVDLYGNVNATHIDGSEIVMGIGGGGDFTRNSVLSIIVMESTAKNGALSRIVPMTLHVDYTEHDVDVIVTEHGVADLRGLEPRERARELIDQCAHPAFRSALREYSTRATAHGGHIPHDLASVFTWDTNGPAST